MQRVADDIDRVEERLERLLASGWRNAGVEAAEFEGEAEGLAESGLPNLADRLRAVANATTATEALPAIALALSACRLSRARLGDDTAPDGSWTALEPRARRSTGLDHVAPIGLLQVEGQLVWVCVRLTARTAAEWLLLDPPFPAPAMEEPPHRTGGFWGRLRGMSPQQNADRQDAAAENGALPWLRVMQGRLRWGARYALGAGEVQRYHLEDPERVIPRDRDHDPLADARAALAAGKVTDGMQLPGYIGGLRLLELSAAEANSYLWPDPSAADAFRAAVRGQAWAVAWAERSSIIPLVLVTPGGRLRPPRLTHLVPGLGSEILTV